VPGERLNGAIVDDLEKIVANGAFAEGASDPELVPPHSGGGAADLAIHLPEARESHLRVEYVRFNLTR
jgi:hypothetical protein